MSSESWRPLNQRGSAAPIEASLFEGVPDHLEQPLRDWLQEFLDEGVARRVGLRLRIVHDGAIEEALVWGDTGDLLQTVDAAIPLHPLGERLEQDGMPTDLRARARASKTFAEPVLELAQMLRDAGSAWTVASGGRALERQVNATVQDAHTAATTAASASGRPEAARDLAEAWAKVYGLHPEPSEAYRLAIRAVEDVAIPLLIPADKHATLGKVRSYLVNAGTKWRLSMTGDVEPLVAMVSLLWTSQTDRHAGQVDLTRVDQKAAEQAVHLATTLVQWFAAGHVQPVL